MICVCPDATQQQADARDLTPLLPCCVCCALQVDVALRQMQERKATSSAGEAATAQLSVMDIASEGLRLRMEMQKAAEEERCVCG